MTARLTHYLTRPNVLVLGLLPLLYITSLTYEFRQFLSMVFKLWEPNDCTKCATGITFFHQLISVKPLITFIPLAAALLANGHLIPARYRLTATLAYALALLTTVGAVYRWAMAPELYHWSFFEDTFDLTLVELAILTVAVIGIAEVTVAIPIRIINSNPVPHSRRFAYALLSLGILLPFMFHVLTPAAFWHIDEWGLLALVGIAMLSYPAYLAARGLKSHPLSHPHSAAR